MVTKYIVLLCDGMADRPFAGLGGRTPMELAYKPNMDMLAARGETGTVCTVPDGMEPGSDVANLSVMGYDPALYYTGRSPLEAVNLGIQLGDDDIAFRCNLVKLSDEPDYYSKTMIDYCADDIKTPDADKLIKHVRQFLDDRFKLYTGTAYRHCLVWQGGNAEGRLTPPHDITGKVIGGYMCDSPSMAPIIEIMKNSYKWLSGWDGNDTAANSLWMWGQGGRPQLPSYKQLYGVDGAVISAVDLLGGIGRLAGLHVCEVEGITGYIDTSYENKAAAALQQLDQRDFVYIHVEAPDECGHRGQAELKVRAIEDIDKRLLAPLLKGLKERDVRYRILILPDHPTPLALRTHTSDPVPYLLYDSQKNSAGANPPVAFTESGGAAHEPRGHKLIARLFDAK